jgi:hypothetical protein
MITYFGLAAAFVLVVWALFSVGFYFFQRRFWSQDRNHSQTAPPSPPEGLQNKIDDHDRLWRPPKAG